MYIVLEIQKNAEGQAGVIPVVYDTLREAEGRFHQILAVAAQSQLPVHAAAVLTEDGRHLRSECYQRAAAPVEPEPSEPDEPADMDEPEAEGGDEPDGDGEE